MFSGMDCLSDSHGSRPYDVCNDVMKSAILKNFKRRYLWNR